MSIGTGPAPARLERGAVPTSERLLSPLARGALRFLLVAAAAAVIAYALARLRLVVVPVIIALLVSTLLQPPTRWLIRRGTPRLPAALLSLAGAILLVAALITSIAPSVGAELGKLGEAVNEGIDQVARWVASGPFGMSTREVERLVEGAGREAGTGASSVAGGLLTASLLALEVVGGALLVLVLAFFFTHDGRRMWRWMTEFVPQDHQERVERFGEAAWQALSAYVRGVAFVATVDSIAIGVALWLIGVPLVLPLAVLTFLAAFVPIVGALVAGGVAALVALVSGGVVDALLVLLAITIIQQVEGNFLYPVVVGRTIDLHAVAILLSVTAGGVLLGIVGAALAVPIVAVSWAGIKAWREGGGP